MNIYRIYRVDKDRMVEVLGMRGINERFHTEVYEELRDVGYPEFMELYQAKMFLKWEELARWN